MPDRHFPVRPDLDQLRHQAKDLLRAIHDGDSAAIAELQERLPDRTDPASVKLADAQLALARSYGAPSWPRLVQSCRLIDAIWDDDIGTVRELVTKNPHLIHENAGIRNGNWGPPLSYAANVGRDRIMEMLYKLGATDLEHALDRAVLQSRIGTARLLHEWLGRPRPQADRFGTPAYSLSVSGTALLFELGGTLGDRDGRLYAPVDIVIESDGRNPKAKHEILAMYAAHGFQYPDTPVMALHRGRIDLLETHLRRDRGLLRRTFAYEEIFPPELRCQPANSDYDLRFPRTPIAGATLLHLCVELDELEIARWLLEQGMAADVRAAVDGDGFGGHTALFTAVVSFPNFWRHRAGGAYAGQANDAVFARLLLDAGANPNARASLRERVAVDGKPVTIREHRDVTALEWGRAFHDRKVVGEPAMRLIAERGGH